jgi:hypothetical protein
MVVALMGATLLATATPSGDPQPATHAAAPAAGAPATDPLDDVPGYRVQLGDGGHPVVPSAPTHTVAATAMRTGRPPLIELETPAGGTLLMLDDRFHHHSVAHREADGHLSVDCGRSATPPPGDAHGVAVVAASRPSRGARATSAPPAACAPQAHQVAGALP